MEKSLQQVNKGVVPDWNNLTGHQLGQLAQPHVQFQMPVSDQLVAVHGEDTNGFHLIPLTTAFPSSKPGWGSRETLESIVRQATFRDARPPKPEDSKARLRDCVGHRKVAKSSGPMHPSRMAPKRRRCESEPGVRGKKATGRGGGTVSNTREDGLNTIMTTKLAELEEFFSQDESENKAEGGEAGRGETRRSDSQTQCPRQSKAAAMHNLSEQRRRDRINEKMKALQKLVPNSSKTDMASMLDEVITYTKQLQAQVEMMKLMRSGNSNNNDDDDDDNDSHVNIPQMMNAMMLMPATTLPPQQQHQMSLRARMAAGLGMLNHASNVTANNAFVALPQQQPLPPHFLMPQMMPSATFAASMLHPNVGGALASMPLHDPYTTFLAQKMSMDDYYHKLPTLHRQQTHQPVRSDMTQRK